MCYYETVINNSLGIEESGAWHEEAAVKLRRYLIECDLYYSTLIAFRSGQYSLATLDGVAKILRKLGFGEDQMGIFHLHDHIPSIMARL